MEVWTKRVQEPEDQQCLLWILFALYGRVSVFIKTQNYSHLNRPELRNTKCHDNKDGVNLTELQL